MASSASVPQLRRPRSTTDRSSLRLRCQPTRGGYALCLNTGIKLILDGEDRTADTNGSFKHALGLLASQPIDVAPAPRPITRGSGPRVPTTSVQVRKTTVIRT